MMISFSNNTYLSNVDRGGITKPANHIVNYVQDLQNIFKRINLNEFDITKNLFKKCC